MGQWQGATRRIRMGSLMIRYYSLRRHVVYSGQCEPIARRAPPSDRTLRPHTDSPPRLVIIPSCHSIRALPLQSTSRKAAYPPPLLCLTHLLSPFTPTLIAFSHPLPSRFLLHQRSMSRPDDIPHRRLHKQQEETEAVLRRPRPNSSHLGRQFRTAPDPCYRPASAFVRR